MLDYRITLKLKISTGEQYGIAKIKLFHISKRLDRSGEPSPAFDNHKTCKNFTEQGPNRNMVGGLCYVHCYSCSVRVC